MGSSPQALASKTHEPLGSSFHSSVQLGVPSLFGDFFTLFISWAQLYICICCDILNGTSIYSKWERFSGSAQSSYLMEINFVTTWNSLTVNLLLVFYAKWFPWGKELYTIHLCFYLFNKWIYLLCPHLTFAIFWYFWILLAANRVFTTFGCYNTNIWNLSDL